MLGSNTFLTDSWSLAPPDNGVPLSAIFSVNLGTEPLSAMSSPGPAVSRDVTHSSRVTCHEQRESCDDDGGGAEEGSFLQTVMQAGRDMQCGEISGHNDTLSKIFILKN